MKQMLANSFAKALSELPAEKVLHCWLPLKPAWDDRVTLHAKAKEELSRLFPNHGQAAADAAPEGTELEPDPVITDETGDDFEMDEDEDEVIQQHLLLCAAHAHLFQRA